MKIVESGFLLLIIAFLLSAPLRAQFPPPAGQPGTTAMHMDSSAFIGWASACDIKRGFINMVDTTAVYNGFNKTTYGSYLYGSGPADGLVISLGDRGTAYLTFDDPIVDRAGPDFAIFENSFGDSFLELAFVEVSSDGERFVRFPSVSLSPENIQIGTFDTIDAKKINNLAGKYRLDYGTPFDLADLKDSSGIKLDHISHIRIIDVGGCLESPYASFDSQGHKINDPWPTPFDTGGFDLDAIGVIHNKSQGFSEEPLAGNTRFYPNPVLDLITIDSPVLTTARLNIADLTGNLLITSEIKGKIVLDLSSFPSGIYMATYKLQDGTSITKKIIKY